MVEESKSSSNLKLYWNIVSQPARAVKCLLALGNVPHDEQHLDLMTGEIKQEPYTLLNPKGLVPFITEGDFKLGESNAILKYLCETQPTIPEHLWPKDPKKRALTDQFLEWYQYHFRPALVYPLKFRLIRMQTGNPIPEDVAAF